MLKKYLLILIASTALMTTTGCSLFSSDTEETDEAVTAEETSVEPGTEGEEVIADTEEEVVDEYPDDDYGDSGASTTAATDVDTTVDSTVDTTTTVTESESADQLPDAPMENGSSDESLFVAGDTSTESSSSTTTTSESSTVRDSYESTANFLPVRKMKSTPYNDGNTLINRLYIARDGDTMKKIATKIYGDASRSKDLLNWNSNLKSKAVNVGDKVYYASARNPSDSSAMLLYYEEAGIQPTMYSAKNGESIRKVSQKLLGHPRSWMEVWATNDLESKWAMTTGTQLRYWPEGAAADATPMTQASSDEGTAGAAAGSLDEAPAMDDSSQNTAANEELPPPSEGDTMDENSMAQNDANKDAGNAAAMGTSEPQAQEVSTPPPPPPTAIAPPEAPAENGLASMMGEQDDSMMMAALGGLLILAALILLIFIKRSRKKVKYS